MRDRISPLAKEVDREFRLLLQPLCDMGLSFSFATADSMGGFECCALVVVLAGESSRFSMTDLFRDSRNRKGGGCARICVVYSFVDAPIDQAARDPGLLHTVRGAVDTRDRRMAPIVPISCASKTSISGVGAP